MPGTASYAIDRSEMSRRRGPPSGESGIGLPSAESDDGDQHGASGTARAVAGGECAEPDATFFDAWLATDAKLRRQLSSLEEELDRSDRPK